MAVERESISFPVEARAKGFQPYVFDYWGHDRVEEFMRESPAVPQPPLGLFASLKSGWNCSVAVYPNWHAYSKRREEWPWDRAIQSGRSYLVGNDMPMQEFMVKFRSPLNAWQKKAYLWCKLNPWYSLHIEIPGRYWKVSSAGDGYDYVSFSLPYHDQGGELDYISCNGRTKIKINVD